MHPIWAAGLAGLGAYLAALADRLFRLHLLSRLAAQVVIVMMPPLALIFLVLGTIFVGIATPTEGGAMGATGALVMALAKRRLTWPLLRQAMDSTAQLSSFVIFILVGASVFSLVFRGVNGDLWVEHLLTSLPGGQLGFLIAVNIMVFLLAFFLDFFELAFIIIPLLGAGRRQARHRSDLVRRAARRQHADLVHASAVRLSRCSICAASRRVARRSIALPASVIAPVRRRRSIGAPFRSSSFS